MIYWRQMLIEINLERKRTAANYTNTHSHSEFLHSFIQFHLFLYLMWNSEKRMWKPSEMDAACLKLHFILQAAAATAAAAAVRLNEILELA